jgi:hypothetical protein
MKLKRYIQFIKESLKEDIEEGNFWKLNEDQIREYFIDFEDAGYLITVEFGFVQKSTKHYYNKPSEEKEIYDEKVLAGENVRPAYWIRIEKSSSINNEDITSSLKFVYSILSEQANADVKLLDADSDVDIDTTLIKGGIFINVDPEDDYSGQEAESYLALFVKQKDSVNITPKDLVNFYGWNVEVEKEGQLWAEIDLEDLADFILSPRGEYKDSLIKGEEYMWDYYDISYYYPERDSLFAYDLDKENQRLLVKALIKDFGGFEKFISILSKYNKDLHNKTEDELVKYLVEERFNTTILNIIKKEFEMSEEPLSEISDIIAGWNQSSHLHDNYKEIVSEFDNIVESEIGNFNKIEKEVKKYYNSKDSEGNTIRKEYTDTVTYYQFPYSNEWIKDVDSDYLYNKDLDNLFRDWVSEENIDRNLNPRISDYGDVDKKKMNQDIRSYLQRFISEL